MPKLWNCIIGRQCILYELWGEAMKKKLVNIMLILLTVCGLTACFSEKQTGSSENQSAELQKEPAKEEKHPSFSDLEDMEEITVEGNIVTVALLQDIPLPYRWAVTYQSENVTLTEEYEAEDPWEDSLLSVGSAEEYHVFVFELAESDLAQVKFHNRWVVEPENLAEANGIKNFILEYTDGQWKVISAESN